MKKVMLIAATALMLAAAPAGAATNQIDTMNLGTNWKSDLEAGSAVCHDSDRQVPVYLTDADLSGGAAKAFSSGNASNCTTRIEIERNTWQKASSGARQYLKFHEADHLRGWTHEEGQEPNHNGTRTQGENAAHSGPINLGFSGPVY